MRDPKATSAFLAKKNGGDKGPPIPPKKDEDEDKKTVTCPECGHKFAA